jgi:hypothetical protein
MQCSQKSELKPTFLLPKLAILAIMFSQYQIAKASSQLSEKNHCSSVPYRLIILVHVQWFFTLYNWGQLEGLFQIEIFFKIMQFSPPKNLRAYISFHTSQISNFSNNSSLFRRLIKDLFPIRWEQPLDVYVYLCPMLESHGFIKWSHLTKKSLF